MAVARTDAALWLLLAGLALLATEAGCLRGSALVAELKAKAKAALLNPSPDPADVTVEGASEDGAEGGADAGGNGTRPLNGTQPPLLTGDPQKDYVYDPNLPRELNGYNLSSYPFYNGVPPGIQFDCDNLHDGFYASVPHKCQVYHHCLFGTRYDFLCANYTAFDQRTFICHFVSEVDCDNSPKFYQRNEALYKAASTSPPVTTTIAPPPPQPSPSATAPPTTAGRRPDRPHRRRPPGRRRRPAYEYYDDDQYDEDEEYYDDEPPPTTRRKATRKHRPQGRHRDEEDDYYEERREMSQGEHQEPEQTSETVATVKMGGPAAGTVYDRPRVPPKVRRPVPIHERDKYDYARKTSDTDPTPAPTRDPKKPVTQRKPADEDEDDYYDEEYDEEYVKPAPKRPKSGSDSRRANGRYRPRQPSRRRPDRYDDDYEEERITRPRKRTRFEDTRSSGNGRGGASAGHRGRFRDEPDPVPADRPGFISNGRFSTGSRKAAESDRGQQPPKKKPSRAVYDDEEEDEEYYDDDQEEEESDGVRRSQKPLAGSNSGGGGDSASSKRKPPPLGEQRSPSRNAPAEEDRCRRDCDRGRSDEQDYDSGSVKRKGVERDNQSQENDNRKHDSDRERLFSSRFRDSQNESSKLKGKSPDAQFQGRPSSGLRATTQSPEPIQRQIHVPRPKPSSDDHLTPQTKLPSLAQDTSTVDFSEEISSGNVKLTNFRSKGRPSASNPLSYTNTKSTFKSRQQQETAEQLEPFDTDTKSTGREEPDYPSDGKSYALPRPFNGATRRQIKTTTETVSIDESPDFPSGLSDAVEEKQKGKPINTDVSYKKVPSEPLQVETYDQDEPKTTYTQVDSRRESILVEDVKSEENDKLTKPTIPEKFQFSSPNIGGVYRRVKVNAAATPTPQTDDPTPSYEGAQASRPVHSNNRPYTLVRPFSPLSDRPIAVEDTTKNAISSSGVSLRRPVKQRTEESERTTPAELRQGSNAYFSSKRGKIRPDENLRGQDRYTKRLSLSGEIPFSKQLPKIEITAPGPSAPDSDRPEIATVKSGYKNDYNAPPQGFTLDIPEEEYDVTLNDALQPSTLHPTRSLIDYRRTGSKARDRPYSVRDPDYVNGGRAASVVAYRAVPALPASQRYVGVAPEAQRQDTQTDSESSANRNQEEYEAIVLTASGGDQRWLGRADQPSHPTEWFW